MAAVLLAGIAGPPERVSFPTQDGGLVYADLYGNGDRGVVLAHGGRFNKESWSPQARTLAEAGFRVLAFDFRGYGQSRGPGQSQPLGAPLHLDVLAAVRYLRKTRRRYRLSGEAWVAVRPPMRRLRLSQARLIA
jgi:pimeloyl-ACP methyl ester carboxylesterase